MIRCFPHARHMHMARVYIFVKSSKNKGNSIDKTHGLWYILSMVMMERVE